MPETCPISFAKAHLSEIIDRIEADQKRIVLTRHGRPVAVLMSPDDLESLEETLSILSDPSLAERIRQSEKVVQHGNSLTFEELVDSVEGNRRCLGRKRG